MLPINSSLHGEIEIAGIADDLQSIICMTNAGCFEIAHVHDFGFVSFAGNKILAAITQKHVGMDALREIVAWNSGSFLLEKSPQPTPTHGAIDLPVTVALLIATQTTEI